MTLQEKIAALPEISAATIKGNFTYEEIKFEILEKMNTQEPNLESMSSLFNELEVIMEDRPSYNIFSERIGLKTLYLNSAYDIDFDILNALLFTMPLVKLDRTLDKDFFNDNEDFQYIKEAFKEYKINNGLTLATVMKYMSTIDIAPLAKELEGQIGELSKLANKN